MKVIGLLSSEEEVEELKFIAHICKLQDRIHIIIQMDRVKQQPSQKDNTV